MFDEWSGWEPTVDLSLRPLPSYKINLPDWEVKAALNGLPPMAEDDRRIVEERASGKGSTEEFSALMERRWELAVAQRAETINEIQPIRDRLAAVQRRLEDAMLEARLRYYLRFDETGLFTTEMPPHGWNGEQGSARFYFCRMNALMPITPSVAGNGFRLIFVDGADLQSLVGAIEAENAPMRTLAMQRRFTAKLLEAAKLNPTANPHTKDWWEALARSDEYHLTVGAFGEAWEQLDTVPGCTWRAQGRRSKTPR